jgi:hypothetical protein
MGYEILRISEHSRDIRIKLRELNKSSDSLMSHLTQKATQKNGIVNAKNIKEIALMF